VSPDVVEFAISMIYVLFFGASVLTSCVLKACGKSPSSTNFMAATLALGFLIFLFASTFASPS
jgi:hypothetical protein